MNMTNQEIAQVVAEPAIDVRVADYFCRKCTNFHDVPVDAPCLAVNLYGLVCFDSENGELLLPLTNRPLEHDHRARIYTSATISGDGTESTGSLQQIAYLNISGYRVDWELLDASGNVIDDTPAAPVESRYASPWNDFKFIRDIVALGGQPLLTQADRNNPSRVKSRVTLRGSYIEVGTPYTRFGQFSEWRARLADETDVVGATSDNMTFVRVLPAQTTTIRIVFTPIGSSPAKDSVELGVTNKRLVLAVTHATTMPPNNLRTLEDTTAFGLLLQGEVSLLAPVFERGLHGEDSPGVTGLISSSDGHCEGGRG